MHHFPLLFDIIIIIGLGAFVAVVCQRLRIPPIVGYLIAGAFVGPSGLSLVDVDKEVQMMAEIGVVMLMFNIGLEFSLKHLARIGRSVVVGGGLQVGVTTLIIFGIAKYFGLGNAQSLFLGFLGSLSSTAIVLSQLQKQAALDAPHGKISLGILIFQDIIIVPMMLFVPFLSGAETPDPKNLMLLGLKAGGLLLFVWLGARFLIPRLLYIVARGRNRELFLLTIVFLVFGIALLSAELGLSLALGAFLAGLMISESEYSHDAVSHILPFRDIFISIFFVSVGMLLDLRSVAAYWEWILLVVGLIFLIKFLTGTIASLAVGFPLRISFLAAVALAQVGEFSFILAEVGLDYGLIDDNAYQVFLSATVITMIAAPFMIQYGKHTGRFAEKLAFLPYLREGKMVNDGQEGRKLSNHLIILGFGVIGRHMAKAAKDAEIPYVVMELNAETVRKESAAGEPIFYGDASYPNVLEHIGVAQARALVIAISDVAAARRAVFLSKLNNPDLWVVVRARYVTELEPLLELGADEVVVEEYEASVKMFDRVLSLYKVDDRLAQRIRDSIRHKSHADLSTVKEERAHFKTIYIEAGSPLDNKRVAPGDSYLEEKVEIIAIEKDEKLFRKTGEKATLKAGTKLIVYGRPGAISEFEEKIKRAEL